MRIVITGALGHIGSFLIRELPKKFPNAKFILIDNMLTQRYPSLFNLNKKYNYQFLDDDVNTMDLSKIVKKNDYIIHLAALTDAANSFDKSKETEKNNYTSTKKVAEICKKKKAKLIHFSSTSVYGTQNEVVDENCPAEDLKPQSPYAECKLKEENYLKKKNDLKFVTLRLGTIFGFSYGIRFHTAVNKFCWQATQQNPITIWKTAFNQKRPYLSLIDVSRAIILIIKNDIFDREIYNVVTTNKTVKEIIDVIKIFIKKIKLNYVNSKIMNQLSYEVDNKKFKNKNFKFIGNLKREINKTIQAISLLK